MSEQELNKVEYTDDKNEELSKVDDQVEEVNIPIFPQSLIIIDSSQQ